VIDAASYQEIKGASVNGILTYASGSTQKSFGGSTDDNGQVSYSWRIGASSTPGTFSISVRVSANGYETAQETGSFQVIQASPSS
jgi:hypothetical protein